LVLGSPGGIFYFSAEDVIDRIAKPVVLSNNPKSNGCKSLVVAQDRKDLSIWFTSTVDELGYIRCDTTNFSSGRLPDPVLLLPKGSSLSFSPLLSGPKTIGKGIYWQTMIYGDRDGNLSLLEQGSDLGLWRKKPFYHNDTANNQPIKSYSITIKAIDEKGSPLKNSSIELSSASAVTGLLNGLAVTLTSSSDWFDTDDQGMLNFIIPTESLASQVLSLEGLRDISGKDIPVQQAIVDPTRRSMGELGAKLQALDDVEKLKAATTQSGKPLFSADNMPSDSDLKAGLQGLKDLHGAYATLPANGKPIAKPKAQASATTIKGKTITAPRLQASGSVSLPSSGSVLDDTEDWFMDKWNWVTEKIEEVGEWVVEFAGMCCAH